MSLYYKCFSLTVSNNKDSNDIILDMLLAISALYQVKQNVNHSPITFTYVIIYM